MAQNDIKNTYEAYLKHPAGNVLPIEEAMQIYSELTECFNHCKMEDKTEYWNDFIKNASDYSHFRCKWELMSNEQKMQEDSLRTATHDSVITAINILARIADKEGIDVTWRSTLGEERKRIGDFACFVAYITGISNR